MKRLDRFGSWTETCCEVLENVGVVAFVLMMGVTTVNVIGAKVFSNPLNGAIDIVMLLQVIAMSFAAGATLLVGRHVAVEFFVNLLNKRWRLIVEVVADLLGLLFFVVLVWRLLELGYSFQTGGEVSGTVRIPLYPFAYAGGAACLAICLVYSHRILSAFMRGRS